jgi:two-component system chemotaxis response regulator CheY
MSATILIVDDSKMVRVMLREALEGAGHRVVEASNGREGLTAVATADPSLVITDINMPEMDGLTMIRELRTDARHRFLPVLVVTTEASEPMKQRGRALGATGWLVKPFQPAQVCEVARCALELREKSLKRFAPKPE